MSGRLSNERCSRRWAHDTGRSLRLSRLCRTCFWAAPNPLASDRAQSRFALSASRRDIHRYPGIVRRHGHRSSRWEDLVALVLVENAITGEIFDSSRPFRRLLKIVERTTGRNLLGREGNMKVIVKIAVVR